MDDMKFDYTGTLGNMDIVLPEAFLVNKDYVYLGRGRYVRTYGVLSFPGYIYVGYFDEIINEMRTNVDCVTIYDRVSNQEAIEKLTDEIVKMESNARLQKLDDAAVDEKINDYKDTRHKIQLGQEVLLTASRLYRVWGSSLDELDKNSDTFENICDRLSIIHKCLALDQKEALRSTFANIYFGFNERKFRKNIDTGGFISMFAKGKSGIKHKNGVYLGKINDTGAPVVFDNFVGPPYLSNPMMLIFGIPGAGKSVLMKLLASRSNVMEDWVVYFDVEGECKKLVENNGGQYIDIRAGVKTGINPFELEVSEDDGVRYIDIPGKIASIVNMLNIFVVMLRGGSLKGTELSTIEIVIRKVYAEKEITEDPDSIFEYQDNQETKGELFNIGKVKKEMPILTDLKNALKVYESTSELADLMEIITGNGSMAMFDCQTKTELKHDLVGVGYKNIRDQKTKAFAILNVLEWVWTKFGDYRYKHLRKRAFVDEGWDLLKIDSITQVLEEFERKGRKYWSQIVMSTHFVDDLLSSKEGKAILKLASTKIIMQQNVDSVDDVAEYFSLPDSMRQELPMFEPGDAIMIAGNDKTMIHIEIFPFEETFALT